MDFRPDQPSAPARGPRIVPTIAPGWFEKVLPVVESALNQLAEEFLAEPYRHRCEHSLHCEIYRLLTDTAELGDTIKVGREIVRPVQKEWPETGPSGGRRRRGNYDLVVLAPCPDAEIDRNVFLRGHVPPGVVIEVGLDYGVKHLQQDRAKVRASGVGASYLVHLARPTGGQQRAVEQEVTSLITAEASGGPKVLYASTSPRRWRPLGAPQVTAAP